MTPDELLYRRVVNLLRESGIGQVEAEILAERVIRLILSHVKLAADSTPK